MKIVITMNTKILSSDFKSRQYLLRRGYNNHTKWTLLFQMFQKSLTQPSSLLSWRMWNPFFGYILSMIYVRFGGNRNRNSSLFMVFILSGSFIHDLVIFLITGVFPFVFSISFQFYFTLIYLNSVSNFERKFYNCSSIRNASLNLFPIVYGLIIGYSINYLLFPHSIIYNYLSH